MTKYLPLEPAISVGNPSAVGGVGEISAWLSTICPPVGDATWWRPWWRL